MATPRQGSLLYPIFCCFPGLPLSGRISCCLAVYHASRHVCCRAGHRSAALLLLATARGGSLLCCFMVAGVSGCGMLCRPLFVLFFLCLICCRNLLSTVATAGIFAARVSMVANTDCRNSRSYWCLWLARLSLVLFASYAGYFPLVPGWSLRCCWQLAALLFVPLHL